MPALLRYASLFVFLFSSLTAWATHNRAGEITYEQLDIFTIRATITTYTKASSVAADRDTLLLCWGDGNCQKVARQNGPPGGPTGTPQGQILPNDTKYNIYVAVHTYPSLGHYKLYMTDPNRNGGICNVNEPNSENIPFSIFTTVTLRNPQNSGSNNSPILLQPPIDLGCVGQPFKHNPNAYDPDGDSLAYRLIVPFMDIDKLVPFYEFPNQIEPGPDNVVTLDEVTGDFCWISPQDACEYNIAIMIIEFRDGQPLDTLIRDMQINILECNNMPPEVATLDEICVIAGETISFNVVGTDPDIPEQQVQLTALGGPFIQQISPAVFNVAPGYQNQPLVGNFVWQTTCEHISDQFYSVVFKVVDSYSLPLADLKTVRIKVVGPPPEDLQGEAEGQLVKLNWEQPYVCENAANEYFRGFSVWKRAGSNPFMPDSCSPGLAGQGYTRIAFNLKDIQNNRYVFEDPDVERGRTYCYRVLAEFAQLSQTGQTFNRVESLPSDEVCVQLARDIPLLTHADVEVTDLQNGKIKVQWSKPLSEDLDTLMNPGPYRYQVLRATGITDVGFQPVPGGDFTALSFADANDTIFIDSTGLNTVGNPYSYKIAFYVNNEALPVGETPSGSSVFLEIAPTDNANILSWRFEVPWDNHSYTIFKRLPGGSTYDSLTTVTTSTYRDTGLTNGKEYCYYIQSRGGYGVPGVIDPILNRSQRVCSIPVDNVPPCPPILSVSNICDQADQQLPEEEFLNNLLWENPINLCEETDDVTGYRIYYTPIEGGEFDLIATVDFALDTTYIHQPDIGIAGCYAVTALDTNFVNESEYSNIVCVDNCPVYLLPNTFTPNGDGFNDLFIPYPYRFIDKVDFQVFNRWGQLVFSTENPDLNWDGRNTKGNDLAEGTYYYVCKIFENRITGSVLSKEILSGYIELLR